MLAWNRTSITTKGSTLTPRSREQARFVLVDPRRLRIDRTPGDNLFDLEK